MSHKHIILTSRTKILSKHFRFDWTPSEGQFGSLDFFIKKRRHDINKLNSIVTPRESFFGRVDCTKKSKKTRGLKATVYALVFTTNRQIHIVTCCISSHPSHVKNSIPFSQFLRLRCLCGEFRLSSTTHLSECSRMFF